jgi:hypothetical protein
MAVLGDSMAAHLILQHEPHQSADERRRQPGARPIQQTQHFGVGPYGNHEGVPFDRVHNPLGGFAGIGAGEILGCLVEPLLVRTTVLRNIGI